MTVRWLHKGEPVPGPVVVEPEAIGIDPLGRICPAQFSQAQWVICHENGMWVITTKDGETQGACRRQMDALRLVQQAIESQPPRPFATHVYTRGIG